MALTKIKLGKYIELYSEKCNIPNLTNDQVSGVNKDKEFFEPSNQVGSDTSKYKIVPPGYFACNLMHVGRDVVLPIAYNHSKINKIVSPAYQVFKFKMNCELISEYFFLYLKSDERDRFFWFNTDGSVRDGMTWDDFINVDIELPTIEIQQKYVDIYNAMIENQRCYEHGLDDLKLVCDGYIDELRKKKIQKKLGNYISLCDTKNDNLKYGLGSVRGISIEKKFIDTKANMEGVLLKPYAIVKPNEFAYVTVTSRNGEKISLARNDSKQSYLCSSSYIVFKVNDESELLPAYLSMLFERNEFNRYSRFNSWGSARETFDWEEMQEVRLPIPDVEIQKDIVNIFEVYKTRKEINEKLKSQIKDICPILIKGSLDEGRKSKEV